MKNIEEFVVWVSVKMSFVWFIAFITLFLSSFVGEKTELFALKLILSFFVSILFLTYLNSRQDEVYKKLWPKKTEEDEGLYDTRAQSMWLPFFLGSLLLFFIR